MKILTNESDISSVYSENIIHNVDISDGVSDNSNFDANLTKARQRCLPCGKKD